MGLEDIVCAATYEHPPELVWRALVTPRALAAWLMENTFERAEVGHRFRFTDRPRPFWDGVCECEVEAVEDARRLALRWGIGKDATSTRVEFTLTPAGPGTRLAFRHSGLHGVMGWFMKKGMTKGWTRMVERSIPRVCEYLARGEVPTREALKAELATRTS